jgi:Beta protein
MEVETIMSMLFPLLKIKSGEMIAYQNLEPYARDISTPIFEILHDNKTFTPAKRVEDALLLLMHTWQKPSREFILDCSAIEPEKRLPNGKSVFQEMISRLTFHSFRVTPCYLFKQEELFESEFVEAVLHEKISNIAVRFVADDLKSWVETEELLQSLISRCGLTHDRVIAILDFKRLPANTDDVARLTQLAYDKLRAKNVKRIVFLATSMLESSDIKTTNKVIEVKRTDFYLWRQLVQFMPDLAYGDYAVIPRYVDDDAVDARSKTQSNGGFRISPSPKVRYTTWDRWLVAKGDRLKAGENNQYPRLAKLIVSHPEFRLNDLTWGNDQIQVLSTYGYNDATNSQVIAIDVNNHLNLCASQVDLVVSQVKEKLSKEKQMTDTPNLNR